MLAARSRLLTANQIDYVPIDEVSGHVVAAMALVYPPRIGRHGTRRALGTSAQ